MREEVEQLIAEVGKAIVGKEKEKKIILAAMFSGGHILLEDIPGVGKTSLALSLSHALGLTARRMQFTSDVLPADVVGYHIFSKDGEMQYMEGVLSCNLFLADEINRTSAKTQSALLEVMEEGRVTVDGITRPVPDPFLVIATENPIGSVGTQMLPESQLDRFMICLSLGYPLHGEEIRILKDRKKENPITQVQAVLSEERMRRIRGEVEDVFIADEIYDYMVNLAEATRNHDWLETGLSPRGTLALARIVQAVAWMEDRNYVLPEDAVFAFPFIARHRIIFNTNARINQRDAGELFSDILKKVHLPKYSESMSRRSV